MNTFRALALLIAAGIAATVAVVYGLMNADARSARKAEARSEAAAPVTPAPPQPPQRRSRLQEMMAAQQQAEATMPLGAEPPTPNADSNATAAPSAQDPLDQAELVTRMDGEFDREPPRSPWSRDAERDARAALTPNLPKGSQLTSLECRTKLCRVETFHQNLDALRTFLDDSFVSRERAIWNGGVLALTKEESPAGITSVAYIAKEGESVATPEEPRAGL